LRANVSIDCGGIWKIVIKDTAGLGCVVEVGSLAFIPSAGFVNEPFYGQVLVTFELGLFFYNWTAGCPNAGGKAGTAGDGKYTGSIVLSSFSGLSVT
jgi:hypothetical protein